MNTEAIRDLVGEAFWCLFGTKLVDELTSSPVQRQVWDKVEESPHLQIRRGIVDQLLPWEDG